MYTLYWLDDDSEYLHAPYSRELERVGFTIKRHRWVDNFLDEIDSLSEIEIQQINCIVVDLLMPSLNDKRLDNKKFNVNFGEETGLAVLDYINKTKKYCEPLKIIFSVRRGDIQELMSYSGNISNQSNSPIYDHALYKLDYTASNFAKTLNTLTKD